MKTKVPNSSNLDFDKVWLMFQGTNKRMKETDDRMKETDKKVKELANLFTTQWGKLVEALVEPQCLKLFQSRGIAIEQSMQNVKAVHGKEMMECDILLVNDTEPVVVEVKESSKSRTIKNFMVVRITT